MDNKEKILVSAATILIVIIALNYWNNTSNDKSLNNIEPPKNLMQETENSEIHNQDVNNQTHMIYEDGIKNSNNFYS